MAEKRKTQQASKAGDTEGPNMPVEEPVPQATEPVPEGGPRIVVNPEVFEDKRDALCVAMNEAFRVLMEVNGFNPVSEPTEAQRRFFADTAYSQNENQMRRTILARICTFDTSVKDPTDEQIAESVEFLETVMEMGAPQNQWEQQAVQRIHDVLVAAMENGAETNGEATPPTDAPTGDERQDQADIGGGETEEEEQVPDLSAPPQTGENGYIQGDRGESIEPSTATQEAAPSQPDAVQSATVQGPQRDDTGYFRDDAGRVISQREAQKLYDAEKAKGSGSPAEGPVVAAQPASGEPTAASSSVAETQSSSAASSSVAESQPSSAEVANVAQSDSPEEPEIMVARSKYSKLTKGEIAWQQRKAASTAAWKKRTGRA